MRGVHGEQEGLTPPFVLEFGSGTACGVRFMASLGSPSLFEWVLGVYKGYSVGLRFVNNFVGGGLDGFCCTSPCLGEVCFGL